MNDNGTIHQPKRVVIQTQKLWYPCFVGVMRQALHKVADFEGKKRPPDLRHARSDQGGCNPWDEIEAACAEYVVAETIHHHWPADFRTKHKTVDIPPNIEVRWTKHTNGHLLLADDDNPTSRYVLVTGALPEYFIHGWTVGKEAMLPEYYRKAREDRQELFMVPKAALHPIENLYRDTQQAPLTIGS